MRPVRHPQINLCHVNVGPFVQQVALALDEAGLLGHFLTTVVEQPHSAWQQWATRVSRLARFDLSAQLRRRSVHDQLFSKVKHRPAAELLRLGVSRVDKSGIWSDLAHEWMETGFSRWAGRGLSPSVDAVYGYENAAAELFRAAKQLGLFCIYDAPAPEHRFSRAILDAEASLDPVLETSYRRHILQPFREQRRDGRRQSEYANADLIVTASSVTRDSFVDYFTSRQRHSEIAKLVVIPYGAPLPDPSGIDGGSQASGPVRIIWAGSFSVRKGARYLLQAWKQLAPNPDAAVLDVYGTVSLPEGLLKDASPNIRFHGPISRDDLYAEYRKSDLLVFPTLCDGFGMVATEALSRGVPVLTTRRAGAADLIKHQENGFIVRPGNTDSLAEQLEYAISHRDELRAMRAAALTTAAQWQWSDYRRELVRIVLERYQAWRDSR